MSGDAPLRCFTVLVLAFLPCFASCDDVAGRAAPRTVTVSASQAKLDGRWQVAGVAIDAGATRTSNYQVSDPRLVGRLFNIDAAVIEARTPEHSRCSGPRFSAQSLTAAELIASSMGGRADADDVPKPADFALPFAGDKILNVVWVRCAAGSAGPDLPGPEGANWYLREGQRIFTRWYDGTLLTLAPAETRPQASFDCAKAASMTERALCASTELAAYDRSVAMAYVARSRQLRETGGGTRLTSFAAAQRQWLVVRDRCLDDVACLNRRMEERLEEIMGSAVAG